MSILPWLVAAWLLAIGLYGIITSRHYVHLIGCMSIVQSSTYVLLLAAGFRWNSVPPVFHDQPPGTPAVDPVVQALVLTDIVVSVATTGLLLALILQLYRRHRTFDPDKLRPMRT